MSNVKNTVPVLENASADMARQNRLKSGPMSSGRRFIVFSTAFLCASFALAYTLNSILTPGSSSFYSVKTTGTRSSILQNQQYLNTDNLTAEQNVEINADAGSLENYDDVIIPEQLLSDSREQPQLSDKTTKLRQRFDSVPVPAPTAIDNPAPDKKTAKAKVSSAVPAIPQVAPVKNINKAAEKPQGSWYQHIVKKGDTLSSIFKKLDLPYATIGKLSAASSNKDLRLAIGQSLSFLIDKDNAVLEMVKPVSKTEQVRFTRGNASSNFKAVHEKINSNFTGKEVVADSSKMPSAIAAASAREDALKQTKIGDVADRNTAEHEVQSIEKSDASDSLRPRLVYGLIKSGESFEGALNRIGLSRQEIASVKKYYSGKINLKKLVAGDSVRVLFNGLGVGSAITAIDIASARQGRVTLFRNADNQKFYEEDEYAPAAGAFKRFPINGPIKVNSRFNPRRMHPITHVVKPHLGVDFKVRVGTPVYSPADGTVKFAGYMRGAGYCVILDHKGGYSTVYMHLSKFEVRKGEKIRLGQVIAKSGNTGYSTGAHLHYELHVNGKAVDPLKAELPSGNQAAAKRLREAFKSNVYALKSDLYKESLATRQ